MADNSFKVKNSLNIEPEFSPNLTEEGDVGYNSSRHTLTVFTSGSKEDILSENNHIEVVSNKDALVSSFATELTLSSDTGVTLQGDRALSPNSNGLKFVYNPSDPIFGQSWNISTSQALINILPGSNGTAQLEIGSNINIATDGTVSSIGLTAGSLRLTAGGDSDMGLFTNGIGVLSLTSQVPVVVNSTVNVAEQATPATGPTVSSGYGSFYAGNDGKAYYKNDGNVVTELTAAGSSITSIGNFDSQVATAKALNLSNHIIAAQSASATNPGMVNTGTQTFAGNKSFTGSLTASNFTGSSSGTQSGTNTGDVDLSTIGGTLAIAKGGTGQTTASLAFNALSPMSARGDMIVGTTSGNAVRIPVGSDTQVWTMVGTFPAWATPVTGFANPMTTGGDSIYGGASGVATRLANGSAGQVYTSSGGTAAPTWTTPAIQSYELNNVGFSTSVGSNVLTIALKQSDGSTDPSTGSAAVKAGFRSSTAGTGGYAERSVTSALSFTISQASSLGLPAVASYLYFYLIDSNGSGTMKLAAAQVKYDEGSLQTTVAESSTVTISNASPGVITETGHTRNANDPIRFTTTGGLPTGLSTGTTYYVKSPISNAYNVSATPGGANINTSSAGSGTHTVHCFGYRLASDGNYSNVSVRFIGRGLFNEPTPGNWTANSTENCLPLAIDQRQKIYAQYTGNASTVISANTTNVDYATKAVDSHGAFSGTMFLAPLTGWYTVNTSILLSGAGSAFDIQYYVNGTGSISQSNGGASSVGRGLSTGLFLTQGDTLSVRLTVGGTLSNSAIAHSLSIASQG